MPFVYAYGYNTVTYVGNMNQIEKLGLAFSAYLKNTFGIDENLAATCTLSINADEQKQAFGDLSTNAPMLIAKQIGKNPRQLAQEIVTGFQSPIIQKIEIAGPGFLNFFLTQDGFENIAQELFSNKNSFFKPSQKSVKKETVNIEFVSANPTGPLHVGHGRGGIIGDVLGNILRFLGHAVTKEFYINDAGSQIQKLGTSLKIRYQQACGMNANLPEDAYHGQYLVEIANDLYSEHNKKLLDQPDSFFGEYAKVELLKQIKQTLVDYGIEFDVWFSEKSLHERAIQEALTTLDKRGYLFNEEGALWFKSTTFGDDKDRVLRKQNGELTYAAADIAYMQNKVSRGHNRLILILGHDHHSYAVRLSSIQQALGLEQNPLNVILFQLVKIKEGGEQVKMSKRAGTIVTLQDLIDTVGRDVARYFYLNRKADAQLEFDLNLALTRSDENPAFYIQYAYVRTGSILDKSREIEALHTITAHDLHGLTPDDALLLKKIAALQSVLETIGTTHHTHLLAYYTHELAQVFNRYYAKNRVIDPANISLSRGRLALVTIVRNTLELCLDLLGLSKPARM